MNQLNPLSLTSQVNRGMQNKEAESSNWIEKAGKAVEEANQEQEHKVDQF